MTREVLDIFPAYRDYLQPARFKVAYGGRGSAKTRTFVAILVSNVLYHGWRVVGFREIMNSIEDSVYQEFVAEIERRDLGRFFQILKTEIKCPISGGVIKFSGIKSNAKRLNTQKLKGFSNFDAAWLEEANPVSAESWNALIPTMRKDGSEIWVSFNPENPLEETYQRFVANPKYPAEKDGKPYCIVKKINFTENPRFPKELADDAELMRLTDPELYR
uniref:PBSX family phage terminase large subunit n=1 Tax=Bacillus thuringiensis TaxID=1428 RepID=UPI002175E292